MPAAADVAVAAGKPELRERVVPPGRGRGPHRGHVGPAPFGEGQRLAGVAHVGGELEVVNLALARPTSAESSPNVRGTPSAPTVSHTPRNATGARPSGPVPGWKTSPAPVRSRSAR